MKSFFLSKYFYQIGPSIICLSNISIPKLVKIPSNKSLNFHNRDHCDHWCIHLLNNVKGKKTYTNIVENTIKSHTLNVHKSLHSQKKNNTWPSSHLMFLSHYISKKH